MNISFKLLKIYGRPILRCYLYGIIIIAIILSLPFYNLSDSAIAEELEVLIYNTDLHEDPEITKPDQLPQSHIAKGKKNIQFAWFAGATDRYKHGVLGDKLEASKLVVQTRDNKTLEIDLPINRVFEDLEPRLEDMNGDGKDEIIVIETDIKLGASLAIYAVEENNLIKLASTPFLGKPNRWLNPLGIGDFNGDGQPDIAIVTTPHIGGVLRLYRYKDNALIAFAEYPGVSTHRIGSTELGLGQVVYSTPRNRILIPNQRHNEILLLEWTPNGWEKIAQTKLPGYLYSSLVPTKPNHWRFRLKNGIQYEIQLKR